MYCSSTPSLPKASASVANAGPFVDGQAIVVLVRALGLSAIVAVLSTRLLLALTSRRIRAYTTIVLYLTGILASLRDVRLRVPCTLRGVLVGVELERVLSKIFSQIVAGECGRLNVADAFPVAVAGARWAVGKDADATDGWDGDCAAGGGRRLRSSCSGADVDGRASRRLSTNGRVFTNTIAFAAFAAHAGVAAVSTDRLAPRLILSAL